ncbi:MAG: molybdenum cofactor biosynthesis protein MoaE [Limisphaerales bacterium]
MKTQLTLTPGPIDELALIAEREMSDGMGAALVFHGVVRAQEDEVTIVAIDYEAFDDMACHQFELIFEEINRQWPIESVRVVHRVGVVPVNEPSLWVEIIAPHRAEAFETCQFLINAMKERVPIWKRPVGGTNSTSSQAV